jgi:pimeloyl-ACP methyl ester carboxylesterase
VDARGIGDSAPGEEQNSLFAPDRRADIVAAIDWLCAKGVDEITLVGACSGAHHAFHLACQDRRVRAVVLVNMVCILWGPSYAMQLRAWQATKAAEMQARAFGADLEEGRYKIAALTAVALPLAKKFARTSFGALKTLSVLAASGLGRINSVESKFRDLAARGVQVRLVYSQGDAGLDELARYMGPDGARALHYANVERILIPDADHTLTQKHAREALAEIVAQLVSEDTEQAAQAVPAA